MKQIDKIPQEVHRNRYNGRMDLAVVEKIKNTLRTNPDAVVQVSYGELKPKYAGVPFNAMIKRHIHVLAHAIRSQQQTNFRDIKLIVDSDKDQLFFRLSREQAA